jgi:hypothetical protein
MLHELAAFLGKGVAVRRKVRQAAVAEIISVLGGNHMREAGGPGTIRERHVDISGAWPVAAKSFEDGRRSLHVDALPAPAFFEEETAAIRQTILGPAFQRDAAPECREEAFEQVLVYRRIELAMEAVFFHEEEGYG